MYLKDIYGKQKISIEPLEYQIETTDGLVFVFYKFKICDIEIVIGDIGNEYREFFLKILKLIENKISPTLDFHTYDWDTGDISEFELKITKLDKIFYIESNIKYLEIFDNNGEVNRKIYDHVNQEKFNDFLYDNHEPGYTVKFYTNKKYLTEFAEAILKRVDELSDNPKIW